MARAKVTLAKDIREAKTSGQLVRVEREGIEDGWLTGYVVSTGPKFFAFELIDGSVRFNGVACIRYSDVTSVAPEPHAEFLERALKARGAARAKQVPVDLASLPKIIASAGKAFPIITLHVPHDDGQGYDCFIGKVMEVGEDSVDLRHISPDAEWEDVLREIPFSEIMRIDFGGDYEDALFIAAR